ncbi:uncharacterized protein LOC122818145 [Drosophila biarmipes]|uniref:uncharacterized protein LOC122818145 n=1 Tax=Drosophila biarmipes TaxID=125945 RepID=UPI001CDB1100|nr:uncharacterized protein LOC122818145 [Drosophila biarmipes]
MLEKNTDIPSMASQSLGYALKRRKDRFVVEPIVGIVNPAYEPDLGGDVSSVSDSNRKWQVQIIYDLNNVQHSGLFIWHQYTYMEKM